MEHFWCVDEPWANMDSQDSPWLKFEGSHHLPPYSILCAWPRGQHSNVIFSRESQVGISKFLKLGLLWLWRPINLCADLWLRCGLKQSCNPHRELFNDIYHVTFMQGNQGDSWLLVVESQIGNLIPDPFFGHNLYFECPTGSCKPISNICVPRTFPWYK